MEKPGEEKNLDAGGCDNAEPADDDGDDGGNVGRASAIVSHNGGHDEVSRDESEAQDRSWKERDSALNLKN